MSTAPGAAPARRRLRFAAPNRRIALQEYTLVGVVVLILVIGAVIEPSSFLTSDNMLNVLRQASVAMNGTTLP